MDFMLIIVIASIIVLLNYILKGMTGFGAGSLRNALLLLFLDVKLVIPLGVLFTLLANILLSIKTYKKANKKIVTFLIIGMPIGTIFGTYFLSVLDSNLLKILFGLFIILIAIKSLMKISLIKIRFTKLKTIIVGFIGSFLGSIFGSGGGLIHIAYFQEIIQDKSVFRSTIALSFMIGIIFRIIGYGIAGLFNSTVIIYFRYLIPATIVGILIGDKLHLKVNQKFFNKIVSSLLFILGIYLILT